MSPPNFPSALITVTVTPGDNTVQELQYAVPLRGVKADISELNIVLSMGKDVHYIHDQQPARAFQPLGAISIVHVHDYIIIAYRIRGYFHTYILALEILVPT